MLKRSVRGSSLVILLQTAKLWQEKQFENRLQSAGHVESVSLGDRVVKLHHGEGHGVLQRVSRFLRDEPSSYDDYFSHRCNAHWGRLWFEEVDKQLTVDNKTHLDTHKPDCSYTKTYNYTITASKFDYKTHSNDNKRNICDNKTDLYDSKTDLYDNKTDNKSVNPVNTIYKIITDINLTITYTQFATIGKKYQQHNNNRSPHDVHSVTRTSLAPFFEHTPIYFATIDKSFAKLLITFSFNIKMGTSCSTNFYDHRDWSSIDNDGGSSTLKSRKHGLFRNRAQSDPTHNSTRMSSDLCNCHLQINNSKETKQSPTSGTVQTNSPVKHSDKRTSTSSNSSLETSDGDQPNSPQSPNVNNYFHNKFSKVIEFMRPRATSSCDVSPHRLLTRRTHYSHYRSSHFDFRSTGPFGHERQRSQSWSNGKLGYHENFRSNPSLRTSVLCPVRSPKGISSRNHANTVSKLDNHKPECTIHSKSRESPKLAVSRKECKVPQDLNEDWTPMPRRRAASESQTMSNRRLQPGAPDDSDFNNDHEHVHVHWADEEKGSSLSTSVFLTSIRPRSYSHGAVGSSPNKPILKKVTGF